MNIRTVSLVTLAALALASCTPAPAPTSSNGDIDTDRTAAATTDPNDGGLVLNPNAADPDFCALVASQNEFDDETTGLSDQLSALLDDETLWTDPATIETMHQTGAELVAVGDDAANYYYDIAAAADDPAVAEAFTGLGDLMAALYLSMGQAAVDAESVEDYMFGFLEVFSSEEVTNLTTLSTDWATTVAEYSVSACA